MELSERRLPELAPAERPFAKVMWLVVAIAVVWGHYYLVRSFWAPAHPGVDQNGYQVGGKLFSQTFSTGVKPTNPFTYVGWMWVQTTDGWVYPKYPLGVPMLDAACIWMAHDLHQGVVWSYLVSPVCTVLASAAMFLMLRMVASSFAAVLGTILIATNPVSLVLANNSNSHAPALAFTCWGILFLLWWMRHGGWWRGLIAGVLLGYALTIRYTEGLLVLPIAAAMLTSIRYKPAHEIRWWAASAWVGAIVVGGMTMRYETFSVYGLHLVLPLVAVGIAIMIRRVFEFGSDAGLGLCWRVHPLVCLRHDRLGHHSTSVSVFHIPIQGPNRHDARDRLREGSGRRNDSPPLCDSLARTAFLSPSNLRFDRLADSGCCAGGLQQRRDGQLDGLRHDQ